MRKIFSAVIGFLFLTSCAEKHEGELKPGLFSNFVSITDNEDNGVKKILDFYGGYCKYAIGASASTDDGKKKYFELELSKSHGLEKQRATPELIASNVAYIFLSNLKEERKNYDEIHAVLIFADGKKETGELVLVDSYQHGFHTFILCKRVCFYQRLLFCFTDHGFLGISSVEKETGRRFFAPLKLPSDNLSAALKKNR